MRVVLYRDRVSASSAAGAPEHLEVELGQQEVTVKDVLRWMDERYGLRTGCCLEDGSRRLRRGVTVALNKRDVGYLNGLDTPVGPDDEVAIVGDVGRFEQEGEGARPAVVLRFYEPLASRFGLAADERYEVDVEQGLTLRGVIERFSANFGPELSDWLLDPTTGGLRQYVGMAINGQRLDSTQRLDSVITPSDQVTVIEFIAGVAGG